MQCRPFFFCRLTTNTSFTNLLMQRQVQSSKLPVNVMLQKKKSLPLNIKRIVAASTTAIFGLYLIFIVISLRTHRPLSHGESEKSPTMKGVREQLPLGLQCSLRAYPLHRYYQLGAKEQPSFLMDDAIYLHGEWPFILRSARHSPQSAKLCVDQSEWLPSDQLTLPFADGTNPSILSIDRLASKDRTYNFFRKLGGSYLATLCMTNSQCAWRDTEVQQRQFNISLLQKPSTLRTVLLVLDKQFQTLAQATIYLDHDAPFSNLKSPKNGKSERKLLALDDARLFLHHGKLWVSYREGKLFGYDRQVMNEIHIANVSSESSLQLASFQATIKASETATLCCGRNMALMEHPSTTAGQFSQLQSLTWVDPITVVDVVDGRQPPRRKMRVPQLQQGNLATDVPKTKKKKKKSHIHGTNAFMVYLENSNEYLGVGHFHRPADRKSNTYARFGHHYTHAFFTITSSAPYRLLRLSSEFVLPASYSKSDAEIIQFASGLEMASHDPKLLVMAYGINDCEGAAMYLDLDYVNSILRPVEQGKEVVDMMFPLRAKTGKV